MNNEDIKSIIAVCGETHPRYETIDNQSFQQQNDNDIVDQTDGFINNRSYLWNAARNGHLKFVQFLIQNGADANHAETTIGYQGCTPLHIAARNNHLEIIKYLIQVGGARVDKMDKSNRTALWWASRSGHVDVVIYLVEEAGDTFIDQADKHGCTPLWQACYHGHLAVVKYLLEMGANHLIQDKNGQTPLDIVQQYGHTPIMNALKEYRYNNQVEEQENSPSLCFDNQTEIPSKKELEIIIEYLAKKFQSIGHYADRHELYVNEFKQLLAVEEIKGDDDDALLPRLMKLKFEMDRLKNNARYSIAECFEKLSSCGLNDNDNANINRKNGDGDDNVVTLSLVPKLEDEIGVLYSV